MSKACSARDVAEAFASAGLPARAILRMGARRIPSRETIMTTTLACCARSIWIAQQDRDERSARDAGEDRLEEPKTLILSGNIVFKSASSSVDKVEKMLEAASRNISA